MTDDQLTFLQQNLEPNQWPCPTCRGNRRALRLLYPDERVEGEPFLVEGSCRTCFATGVIEYDPNDMSSIPF